MRYDQAKQYLTRSCDIFASTSTLCQHFPEYFGLGPFAMPELNEDCKWPTVFLVQHQIPSIFQPKYKYNTNWCKYRHRFRCIYYYFAIMKDIVSLKGNMTNKNVKYTSKS